MIWRIIITILVTAFLATAAHAVITFKITKSTEAKQPIAIVPFGWQHSGEPLPAEPGSEEEFITEHYWGYTAQADGSSLEYRVEHVSWRVWQTTDTNVDVWAADLYGPEFVEPLARRPSSAFLAEGSPVTVYQRRRLR